MQNQITVVNNGTNQEVELISYFELVNSSKKYLFYTLNEKVENNLVKMYASIVDSVNGKTFTLGQDMSDEEWNSLKAIMKTILTGGNDTNIKYLTVN